MKQITFEQWNELALMTLDVGEMLREIEKSPASFQYFQDGTVRKKASFANGFVCDGAWVMPGMGDQLQFTKRHGPGPAFGATFYLPVGSSVEAINRRADEVCREFEGVAA